MYGYECPECGATLDPGEKCDCIKRDEACEAATKQTSNALNANTTYPNYTTLKGGVSSA